jgi:pimeloyl-ACP methyl ester carboxylesterase
MRIIDGSARPSPASIHHARTVDGWEIALHRHRGEGDKLPVILCPGYGCSAFFLDYDDRYSLARFLARCGHDVWVLDLRGRGASRTVAPADPRRWTWTFDDFVRYDVPAAIALVRAETGRRRVGWVGHSMGGSALYAFAGSSPLGREAVAAVVTIASPVLFPPTAWKPIERIGRWLLHLPLPRTVPQRELVSLLWDAIGLTGWIRVGMNPHNIDRRLAGRALRRSLHNVSLAKLRQLAVWSADQVFRSADGSVDYRSALRHFDLPLLILAGTDDRLASPASVRLALNEVSSSDKTYVEVGERSGFSADYGHIDLVLGRHAPDEVFPRIGSWLDRVGV